MAQALEVIYALQNRIGEEEFMKMNAKFSLALIALVGIGVFALPSTVALFSGQHSFYNIDATGNQVPCQKCHGDVKAELSSGGSTVTGTKGPHADFKCEYCHRAEAGMSSGDNAIVSLRYSNVTGPATNTAAILLTTIENFETGNFPKQITGTGSASKAIDWSSYSAKNLDLTPFAEQKDYRDSTGNYSGQISATDSGIVYNISRMSETSTYSGGKPKDQTVGTQNNAVDPRAVTINAATLALDFNGSGSREVTPGTRYHAASLVSCMECHGGEQEKGVPGYEIESAEPYMHSGWLIDATDPSSTCSNCHYSTASHTNAFEASLAAGGFGLTTFANDTGITEAHNDFVRASGGLLRKGYGTANDACVACHTHVAVDINFQKKYALKFDANAFNGGNSTNLTGNWGIGGFTAQGTVNVEEFGNQSGNSFATGNHSYSWTPDRNLYMVDANGTNYSLNVTGLNNEASDNQSALTSP